MLQILAGLIARPALLGCIALGAAAGTQTWRLHSLQTQVAEDRATQAEAQRMAERRARATETRTAKAVEGITHDARTAAASLDADAADARRAGNGLRLAAHQANTACRATSSTSTAGRSDAADDAALVPADMLERLVDVAVVLAEAAGRANTAGIACQRAYAAVTSQGDDGGEN
jgi:hypothetical protein